MNLFGVLEVSASALGAERMRAEVVASNLANAESTRTPEGGPYRRREVIFASRKPAFALALAQAGGGAAGLNPAGGAAAMPGTAKLNAGSVGVQARAVVEDTAPPLMRYEPGHPDADANGYVAYPNVNPASEMADLMGASRSYEMNVSAISATKQMIQQSLEILK